MFGCIFSLKEDAVKLEGNVPIICDNIAKGCNLNEVDDVNNLFEALNRKKTRKKNLPSSRIRTSDLRISANEYCLTTTVLRSTN